jgi:hypothetical protein
MFERNNKGSEGNDGLKQYTLIAEGNLKGHVCFEYQIMMKNTPTEK